MKKGQFYGNLAFYYDFICEDRKGDVEILRKLIRKHKKSNGKKLLDVACGTGLEDKYLKKYFDVKGIDLNKGVLKIARKRNPKIKYKIGDMIKFKLNEKFDIITCFDAMSYLLKLKDMKKTLKNFYNHLRKGGVLIFYIDNYEEHYKENYVGITKKCKNGLHVTLIDDIYIRSKKRGEYYLIFIVRKGNKSAIFFDRHNFGIFSIKRLKRILSDLGFMTYLYDSNPKTTFSTKRYSNKTNPVFVCIKK